MSPIQIFTKAKCYNDFVTEVSGPCRPF